MIDLARDISCKRLQGSKVTFQFNFSVAVVGYYPIWKNEKHVPEDRMSIEAVPFNGYGDAKYICELMLDKTLHQHPDRLRTSVGRPGQIAGLKISGYWNPQEHLIVPSVNVTSTVSRSSEGILKEAKVLS